MELDSREREGERRASAAKRESVSFFFFFDFKGEKDPFYSVGVRLLSRRPHCRARGLLIYTPGGARRANAAKEALDRFERTTGRFGTGDLTPVSISCRCSWHYARLVDVSGIGDAPADITTAG